MGVTLFLKYASLGAWGFVFATATAWAQEPGLSPNFAGTSSLGVLSSSLPTSLPPWGNAGNVGADAAGYFQGCGPDMGAMINTATQALTGLVQGNAVAPKQPLPNGSCPGTDTPPELGSLSCESFPGGRYDPSYVKMLRTKIEDAIGTAMCKDQRLSSLQNQINCFQGEARKLADMAGGLNEVYNANISQMQQQYATVKDVEKDVETHITNVNQLLKGRDESGEGGMLQGEKDLKGVIQAMNTEVEGVRSDNQKLLFAEGEMKTKEQFRSMEIARDCFTQVKDASLTCATEGNVSKPGQPVQAVSATPMEYAACRFEQQLYIGPDGNFMTDEATRADAKARSQQLRELLGQMFSSVPDTAKLPGPNDPAALQAALAKPVAVITAADLQRQYGARLAAVLGGSRGPVTQEYITRSIAYCFSRGDRQLDAERNSKAGPIAEQRAKFEDARQKNLATSNTYLEKYVAAWEKGYSDLSGDTRMYQFGQTCKMASTMEAKLTCFKQLQKDLPGLLNGNSTESFQNITVKGTNPQTNIVLNCNGLSKCIRALQNVSKNLDTEKQKIARFKDKFKLFAKQQVNAFTQRMATSLNMANKNLMTNLNKLNTMLAAAGVKGLIKPTPVEGEQLEFDEDGMPKPPKSSLAMIGGSMNPKLLDLDSGKLFGSALEGITETANDVKKKIADGNALFARLDALGPQCGKAVVEKLYNKLEANVNAVIAGNCASSRYCEGGGKNSLEMLIASVDSLGGGPGLDVESVSSLSSGLAEVCTKQIVNRKNEEDGGGKGDVQIVASPPSPNCAKLAGPLMKDAQAVRAAQGRLGGGPATGAGP